MIRSLLTTTMLILSVTTGHLTAFAAASDLPRFRLEVSFDLPGSRVMGRVLAPIGREETLRLRTGPLTITGLALNNRPVEAAPKDGVLAVTAGEAGTLEVRYEGRFQGGETLGERNYGVVSSSIGPEGISLTGHWHPQTEGLAVWKLSAVLPQGYEALSEAEAVVRERVEGGLRFSFDFPHPVDGLSFVATDRYEVTTDRHGQVELAAYFFREDRELAKTYLRSVKRYIALYEKLLTPFPFRRFAVVENFLPTGYSMPTFTLLGQDVVRLPFITETSLGHEVLHQWFGNAVLIDHEKGNWAEGLTTYLADHWYDEEQGAGAEHRKRLLVNYAAYVREENELPLRAFRSRTDPASRAIGYGKAAMVFHMLRKRLGDERFFNALRELLRTRAFRQSSWEDLATVFGRQAGTDLSGFFSDWVDGKGLPVITLERSSVRRAGSRFEATATVARGSGPGSLDLPVVVRFLKGGERREVVALDAGKKEITLLLDDEPAMLVLDPGYDLARRLTPMELPPVLARLLGDARPLIVPAGDDAAVYEPVIEEFLKGRGRDEAVRQEVREADLRGSTLLLLGAENPVARRLFGPLDRPEAGFSITVRRNPWDPERVAALVHARSADEARAAVRKLGHYGKYSHLAFENGRNREKRIEDGDRGIIALLREEPVALDLTLLRPLAQVISGVEEKRIVYVGEYHDRHSHHDIQVQIIRGLLRQGRPLAVGMEMFQRPFQSTLDDYIAGSITEREFLARSEYFKRWGFDYNLYKPVLDLCRQEKVPVVALNLRREITEKVAKSGMDALSAEERGELPASMDLSDEAYRQRLRAIFDQHRGADGRSFDDFLQAQVIWDEAMAESVDGYLRDHPDRRMVVIAGGGHLAFGAGIPKRVFRRNGLPYAVILNDVEVEPLIADYIVLTQPLEGMSAPKLMATFQEEGDRLLVRDFVKESPAKAAGVRAGDALLALDGLPVAGIQDVKLALHFKQKGDSILLTVARKRFLLGEKVMTFEVKL